MEARIQKLLDAFATMRDTIDANTTFGEPVEVKDLTVVPVTEVAYRFEANVGPGPGMREGAPGEASDHPSGGGAISTRPLAIMEVTPEGTRVKPIVDRQRVLWGLSLLAGWTVIWLAAAAARILGQRD